MLESFKIKNFALLKKARLELEEGLNVITGETGAGKSILIGALSMVLGEWVGREVIRTGEDTCEVEVEFRSKITPEISAFLNKKDLGESELIIRRIFSSIGRSKCYINDHNVTLATLRELGNILIDIHSQNQHQAILKKSNQMRVLDKYACTEKKLTKIKEMWQQYNKLKSEKNKKIEEQSRTEMEVETLRTEIAEIDSVNLSKGMDEKIEKEYRVFNNIETLNSGAQSIYNALYEKDRAVIEEVADAVGKLEKCVLFDEGLKKIKDSVQDAQYELESACEGLRSYLEGIDSNPQRLDEVIELREKIADLKRKYGADISSILQYRKELDKRIADYDSYKDIIETLDKKIKGKEKELNAKADELTWLRKTAAEKLSKEVGNKLGNLGMKDADFEVRLNPVQVGPSGKENIEFFIMTNPGEPRMELSRVASGGEISRIMLALKSALAGSDNIPILVFDEIDVGIGATIGGCVGKELKKLSRFHQVIVVTHLPQIAGFADVHIKVEKKVSGDRTFTVINKLCEKDRVNEIARMLTGAQDDISNKQALRILGKT